MKYFALFFSLVTAALSVKLTSDTFEDTISDGVWVVNFESPYCGYCRGFKPLWNELVEENLNSSNPGIRLVEVDCSVSSGESCINY